MRKAQEDDVNAFGYQLSDLGTLSIRKGAITYVSSQPGGPTAAAICIQAGWAMGGVMGIYMKYQAEGDMFVGRLLSLLNLLLVPEFAVSPPKIHATAKVVTNATLNAKSNSTFPMLLVTNLVGAVLGYCLVSRVFHLERVAEWDAIHVIKVDCPLYGDAQFLSVVGPLINPEYPWDGQHIQATGIPSHVAVMHQIRSMGEALERLAVIQGHLADEVDARMNETLDARAIGA